MMTIMFGVASLLVSLNFLFMNHPLAMGLALLIQTLIISLSAGLMAPSFWFSYILFLVFLGGMLVLFIYVASLASNEMFTMSPALILWIVLIMLGLALSITILDASFLSSPLEFVNQNSLSNTPPLYNTFMFKMYHTMNYIITLLMIMYLLLALVIIANIVMVQEGPLRPMT